MEKWLSRLPHKQEVAGSNPAPATIIGVSLAGRTPGFGPGSVGS